MAMQEANGIVDSYLQGIQLAMQRKRDVNEQQYRAAETERAKVQTDLLQKQYDEQIKQNDLAHKASMATFQLQAMMHGKELAQGLNNENTDPTTPGKYTIQGPDGNPVHFNAQTPAQQLNQEKLLKTQDAEVTRETERIKQEQDQKNRLAEILAQGTNAKNLEVQRGQTEERITRIRTGSQMAIDRLNNERQQKLALFQAGLIDPNQLTGGAPDTTPGQIFDIRDKAFSGDLTNDDLKMMHPALQRAATNQVIKSGGVIVKKKDLDTANHLRTLANIAPRMAAAINEQSDDSAITSRIKGFTAPVTNAELANKFDQIKSELPNIAKGIGGEQGQRLTNFTVGLSEHGYAPSLSSKKSVNIQNYNNFVNKIHDVLENEVFANYPAAQKALLIKKLGFDKLTNFPESGGSSQQSSKPTAAQFDRSSQ